MEQSPTGMHQSQKSAYYRSSNNESMRANQKQLEEERKKEKQRRKEEECQKKAQEDISSKIENLKEQKKKKDAKIAELKEESSRLIKATKLLEDQKRKEAEQARKAVERENQEKQESEQARKAVELLADQEKKPAAIRATEQRKPPKSKTRQEKKFQKKLQAQHKETRQDEEVKQRQEQAKQVAAEREQKEAAKGEQLQASKPKSKNQKKRERRERFEQRIHDENTIDANNPQNGSLGNDVHVSDSKYNEALTRSALDAKEVVDSANISASARHEMERSFFSVNRKKELDSLNIGYSDAKPHIFYDDMFAKQLEDYDEVFTINQQYLKKELECSFESLSTGISQHNNEEINHAIDKHKYWVENSGVNLFNDTTTFYDVEQASKEATDRHFDDLKKKYQCCIEDIRHNNEEINSNIDKSISIMLDKTKSHNAKEASKNATDRNINDLYKKQQCCLENMSIQTKKITDYIEQSCKQKFADKTAMANSLKSINSFEVLSDKTDAALHEKTESNYGNAADKKNRDCTLETGNKASDVNISGCSTDEQERSFFYTPRKNEIDYLSEKNPNFKSSVIYRDMIHNQFNNYTEELKDKLYNYLNEVESSSTYQANEYEKNAIELINKAENDTTLNSTIKLNYIKYIKDDYKKYVENGNTENQRLINTKKKALSKQLHEQSLNASILIEAGFE